MNLPQKLEPKVYLTEEHDIPTEVPLTSAEGKINEIIDYLTQELHKKEDE